MGSRPTGNSPGYLRVQVSHGIHLAYGLASGDWGGQIDTERLVIRFRFPFPGEDGIPPGGFESHDRKVAIHGVRAPADIEHGSVQFQAAPGYLVSLPCPEGAPEATPGLETAVNGLRIHRNGFVGAVHLVQQKWQADGTLAIICQCGGCGAAWRVGTLEEAKPYIAALIKEAESREHQGRHNGTSEADGRFYRIIAARIEHGYTNPTAPLPGSAP